MIAQLPVELLPETAAFLDQSPLGGVVGGQDAMAAGSSWINAHNVFPHGVPYAGVNKSGLGGGVLSEQTLLDYWRNLSVVRPL